MVQWGPMESATPKAAAKKPLSLDLRYCRVCKEVAYQGKSVCLNVDCVPWSFVHHFFQGQGYARDCSCNESGTPDEPAPLPPDWSVVAGDDFNTISEMLQSMISTSSGSGNATCSSGKTLTGSSSSVAFASTFKDEIKKKVAPLKQSHWRCEGTRSNAH